MNENIEIVEFKEHSKASEKSVLVLMKYPNKKQNFFAGKRLNEKSYQSFGLVSGRSRTLWRFAGEFAGVRWKRRCVRVIFSSTEVRLTNNSLTAVSRFQLSRKVLILFTL